MRRVIARHRRTITLACVGLLIAGLTASWLAGGWMMRGRQATVAAAMLPAEDIRIATPDGVVLAATYHPGSTPSAPAVLLLHGVDASRASMTVTASRLSAAGYATLAIDFRGHGQSDLRPRSFGWREAIDARAAFIWLKRHQHGGKIGVIGISMGGAASLLGPEGPLPVDALVLQAVYPDFRHAVRDRIAALAGRAPAYLLESLLSFQTLPRLGLWPGAISPIRVLATVKVPVLVIGGRHDRYTPLAETMQMFEAIRGSRSIWIVAKGDHAAICALDTWEYHRRLLNFFRRTIGNPSRR